MSSRTSLRFLTAAASATLMAAATSARADVLFQDNFETAPEVSPAAPQSDSLDADPVAQVGTWSLIKDRAGGGGVASEQVTNFATPGPHTGNNYLRLTNTADSEAIGQFTSAQTSDVTISSWINTAQTDVRVFVQDAAGDNGLFLSWSPAGTLRYSNGAAFVETTVPWTANAWQHLVINTHQASGTYDVTLDGNAALGVPSSGFGPLANFDHIFFAGGGSPPMFVDDVSVTNVPEPGALSLLVASAVILQRRRAGSR